MSYERPDPQDRTPPDSATTTGGDGAAPGVTTESPAPPPAPPRAVWNSVLPTAPWCPDEWRDHLDAVAPGLFASGVAAAQHEAVGGRVSADGWTLIAAARRGRLHAHRGEHREDAQHLLHFADGWCAAVADGAGSAPYSRLGSAIATHAITHAVREALLHGRAPRDLLGPAMRQGAQAANDRLRTFAQHTGLALRDLRTTLLVATLHQRQLAVMQVGDGAMTVLHHEAAPTHPHAAATGDYSGEVAHFLPDDGALDVLQSSLRMLPATDVRAVLLATDGVEDPWYPFTRHAEALVETLVRGTPDDAALPASLTPAWRDSVVAAPDAVHALVEWLAFEKRGENDDRTLCLAWSDVSAAHLS